MMLLVNNQRMMRGVEFVENIVVRRVLFDLDWANAFDDDVVHVWMIDGYVDAGWVIDEPIHQVMKLGYDKNHVLVNDNHWQ